MTVHLFLGPKKLRFLFIIIYKTKWSPRQAHFEIISLFPLWNNWLKIQVESEPRLQRGGLDTALEHWMKNVGCNWSVHAICAAMFKRRMAQDQLIEAWLAWESFWVKKVAKESVTYPPINPLETLKVFGCNHLQCHPQRGMLPRIESGHCIRFLKGRPPGSMGKAL